MLHRDITAKVLPIKEQIIPGLSAARFDARNLFVNLELQNYVDPEGKTEICTGLWRTASVRTVGREY